MVHTSILHSILRTTQKKLRYLCTVYQHNIIILWRQKSECGVSTLIVVTEAKTGFDTHQLKCMFYYTRDIIISLFIVSNLYTFIQA